MRAWMLLAAVALASSTAADTDLLLRQHVRVEPPAVELITAGGERVDLPALLSAPGPVMLQLIFTTCPTICPIQSATFAAASRRLADLPDLRLVSISIDPEHDTPERLKEYAAGLGAGPGWLFLTGESAAVVAAQKAFGAFATNKMRHEPLSFLRAAPGEAWLRLEGFPSAEQLAAELRALLADAQALGRQIYRDGRGAAGEPVAAVVAGDVELAGRAVACATCHRRSGFGAVEGSVPIPPITARAVFEPWRPERAELFRNLFQEEQGGGFAGRIRTPRNRPAYDAASLARALREGRDPAGRALDAAMPRYRLNEAEVAALARYLATLSAHPDPGVDAETIHFATVVSADLDPAVRRAMLDVVAAYLRRKNADLDARRARPGFSPLYKDELLPAERRWVHHVWELRGRSESWGGQLESFYREQPVFALLGGAVPGGWSEVQAFCERNQVPGLFPHTDLPASEPGAFTLYFSKGLAVEGEVLGRFLLGQTDPVGEILQVYRDDALGRVPSAALRATLAGASLREATARELAGLAPAPVLVLWLETADLAALGEAPEILALAQTIYVSTTLVGEDVPEILRPWAAKLRFTNRFALPGAEPAQIYRVRAWLRSRRVAAGEERVQLETWFALAVTEHALAHLLERYSRDYLVERIEHETENALNPGVFPALSLGPGQRYASRGAQIVRAVGEGKLEAVSGWIVP